MSTSNVPSVFYHPGVFSMGKYTGISRYICSLLNELENMGISFGLPLRHTDNGYLPGTTFFQRTSKETPSSPLSARLLHSIGRHTSKKNAFDKHLMRETARKAFRRGNYNLIHPTHTNELGILEYAGNTPMVITIHDMIHEILPTAFPANDPTAARKKLFADRAERIIAISEKTKQDIIDILHISPDKIDVVHHGNSLTLPDHPELIPCDRPERYLLFVGHRTAYKNFDRMLAGLAPILRNDRTLHLLCIGGTPWTRQEQESLRTLDIASQAHQQYADDTRLALLYHHALAFIFPSYYEGFGLPILEAFACGAPVLCARASCFPEIGGDASLYFDPHDENSIGETVISTIRDQDKRQEMISQGTDRLSLFTWEKAARNTLDSYRLALQQASHTA
ncbi:glycosyltransferase family 4 protein [Akkermansia glycaniphila]|uniref:glycosyltransferase family 4 protein n=1 Tax=Akkermansia glycaniphila TaxID=1679444 RepID=UPI001C039D6E|nr:glycosyltransferase family 1 protein [Akkermansia glycaniphila]MBT9448844.1 glycosyltransferase family 4 protein [Akkermansia glycaniphila]